MCSTEKLLFTFMENFQKKPGLENDFCNAIGYKPATLQNCSVAYVCHGIYRDYLQQLFLKLPVDGCP